MSLKEILSEMSVPKKAADFLAMLFCFVLFFVFILGLGGEKIFLDIQKKS